MFKNIKIIPFLLIMGLCNVSYGYDFKECMNLELANNKEAMSVSSGLMKNVLQQENQLEKIGKSEDVDIVLLASYSSMVNISMLGFVSVKTVMRASNFKNKEQEEIAKSAFANVASIFFKSTKNFVNTINDNIAFIKNQSIREDLKSIRNENEKLLRYISVCEN
jgi:hypothetical protein